MWQIRFLCAAETQGYRITYSGSHLGVRATFTFGGNNVFSAFREREVYVSGGTLCESRCVDVRFTGCQISLLLGQLIMVVDVMFVAALFSGAVGPGHRPSGQTNSCCVRAVFYRSVTSVDGETCAYSCRLGNGRHHSDTSVAVFVP